MGFDFDFPASIYMCHQVNIFFLCLNHSESKINPESSLLKT